MAPGVSLIATCCVVLTASLTAIPPSRAFAATTQPTSPSTTFLSQKQRSALTMTAESSTATRLRAPLTQSSYRANLNPTSPIQSSDVATLPKPGTSSPSSIKFHTVSSDEVWATYLLPSDPTSLTRMLYATRIVGGGEQPKTMELFQPGGGGTEDDFSPEEKLRRERARMMATGVTSYAWASGEGAKAMLVPFGGALWLLDDPLGGGDASSSEPRKVVETNTAGEGEIDDGDVNALPIGAPLLDAKISSDGSTLGFVCGDEVYVVPTTGAAPPRRITTGARGVEGKINGVADYLAQEELERADGFWLSPKGSLVAYEEVDDGHVPSYRIVHQGEDRGLAPTFTEGQSQLDVEKGGKVTHEETKFIFAGARNPVVKFGIADATKGCEEDNVKWFDLTTVFGEDFYLAKVEWLPADKDGADSKKLVVQIMNRRQNELALLLLDYETGTSTTLHVERYEKGSWVNLNGAFHPLPVDDDSAFRFLWASERDGFRHLYVLESSLADGGSANAADGGAKVVRRITGPGEFICEEVLDIDEVNGHIYYMGTEPGEWLERHLFRVSLDSTSEEQPTCLTRSVPGQHSCVLNAKAGVFVDTVSSVSSAPIVTFREIPSPSSSSDPKAIGQLHDAGAADPRIAQFGSALQPPTFHTFPSTDGKVTLQAAMYLPDEEVHGKGPYPLVVATYGGPHVQYVQNTWGMMTADMRSQFLRTNGFAVLKVDNRGSNRRGLGFETPVYGNMGEMEVADQVAGVKWAVEKGIADEERVSVSGWSYGGYMALKCLQDRPDVFHAAVSGAPVTDWALYDSAYTERYMGLPYENPEGYVKASALANVKDIEGSLLLCHGLLDENVLFRQSAVLANALIEHQKAYDLALFPSERHGPRRPQDRAFLEERILAFLQRSLGV